MPDPRMAEHFRCDKLKLTLSRSNCAVQHIRGARQVCVGCEIGASHKAGHPHAKAPALVPISAKAAPLMGVPRSAVKPSAAAPKPLPSAEPKPQPVSVAQERADRVTRDRTAKCTDCGHEVPCATMGRLYACPKCGGRMQRTPKAAAVSAGLKAHADRLVESGVVREPQSRCAFDLCGKPCALGQRYCSHVCERDDTGQPVLSVSVRLAEDDHALVTAAAKRAGMPTAVWARAVLLGAAAITGGVR